MVFPFDSMLAPRPKSGRGPQTHREYKRFGSHFDLASITTWTDTPVHRPHFDRRLCLILVTLSSFGWNPAATFQDYQIAAACEIGTPTFDALSPPSDLGIASEVPIDRRASDDEVGILRRAVLMCKPSCQNAIDRRNLSTWHAFSVASITL